MLFISGQIPVDTNIGSVVPGGVAEQTNQVNEEYSSYYYSCRFWQRFI